MNNARLHHPDLPENCSEQDYIRILTLIFEDRIKNKITTEKELSTVIKIYKVHRSPSTKNFAFSLLQRIVDGYPLTPKQLSVVDQAKEQIDNYTYYMPRDPDDTPSRPAFYNNEDYESERYTNDNGDEVAHGRDRMGNYTANYSKGYTTYGGMGGTISFDHETGEEC
jgi:hypothetical protein